MIEGRLLNDVFSPSKAVSFGSYCNGTTADFVVEFVSHGVWATFRRGDDLAMVSKGIGPVCVASVRSKSCFRISAWYCLGGFDLCVGREAAYNTKK